MALIACPTCRRKFETDGCPTLPFCSERCRLVDLGRWLNEDYSLPVDPEAEDPQTDWPDDDGA